MINSVQISVGAYIHDEKIISILILYELFSSSRYIYMYTERAFIVHVRTYKYIIIYTYANKIKNRVVEGRILINHNSTEEKKFEALKLIY